MFVEVALPPDVTVKTLSCSVSFCLAYSTVPSHALYIWGELFLMPPWLLSLIYSQYDTDYSDYDDHLPPVPPRTTGVPILVDLPPGYEDQEIVSMATSAWHGCVLFSGGDAWCMGSGVTGPLGTGSEDHTRVRMYMYTYAYV